MELNPAVYWQRHEEAWEELEMVNVATGDVDREEFYHDLWDAANWLKYAHGTSLRG